MTESGKQRFHYCPKCGGKLYYRPHGDRQRLKCVDCHYIFHENPIVGVAAIVFDEGKVLLGRRSPGATYPGLWCIPCGYVEYDEDVYDAVRREMAEETGLTIVVDKVYTVLSNFHNPEVHTVGIWFQATVTAGELKAGDDLSEVAWFSLSQLPPLAFPTDRQVLERLAAVTG